MRPLKFQRLRLALISILILLILVAAGVMVRLHDRLEVTHATEQSRPAWVTSRLEFEYLRLHASLADFVINRASVSDVRLRFDLLWSRANILREGDVTEYLRRTPTAAKVLEEVEGFLVTHEAAILALKPGQHEVALAMLEDLDWLRAGVRSLVNDHSAESSIMATEHRQLLLLSSNVVAGLFALIALGAAVLVGHYALSIRAVGRVAQERLALLRAAETAAVAKDQFISVINHELRTPLTSINGSLALLKGGAAGELPAAAQRLTQIAHVNCARLGALINDLLDIDRIQSGEMHMDRTRLDLPVLLREAIEANEGFARQHRVSLLAGDLPAGLDTIGDPVRLHQVLSNLISNAVKFSEPGQSVELGLERCGDRAVIRVSDQGLGIPADQQELIFERFKQVDSSDHRKRGGSGLGLSITRAIVTSMNGRVWLRSAPGQGTTFHVELPLGDENAARREPRRLRRAGAEPGLAMAGLLPNPDFDNMTW